MFPENGMKNIDLLIAANDLQQIGNSSTGNLSDIVGSIGPVPFIDTKEGQDFLLSLVTGSSGGAIGGSIGVARL